MAQGDPHGTRTPTRTIDREFDDASIDEMAKAVREVIQRSSLQTAVLALEPVPLLDNAVFIPIQHRMVRSIGRLRGYSLDGNAVAETFASIRGHLFVPNAIIALAKLIAFIPILSDLISATVAYALTSAIGKLSDCYFRTGRAMSPVEMKATFDALFKAEFVDAFKERRDELRAIFRSPELRREIGELKRAHKDGTMDSDEVARRTMQILNRRDHR